MTDPRVPMAPKTEAGLAEYVRDHRCYSADPNVSIGDWNRGVRAIEAESAAQSADAVLALREALDTLNEAGHSYCHVDDEPDPDYQAFSDALDRAHHVLADTEQAAQARVKEIKEAAEREQRLELDKAFDRIEPIGGMSDAEYAGFRNGIQLARALLGERERPRTVDDIPHLDVSEDEAAAMLAALPENDL